MLVTEIINENEFRNDLFRFYRKVMFCDSQKKTAFLK